MRFAAEVPAPCNQEPRILSFNHIAWLTKLMTKKPGSLRSLSFSVASGLDIRWLVNR